MSKPAFTIPESHAHLSDSRPIVKVMVDVAEPIGYLTSGLIEISSRNNGDLLADTTVNYITNTLLDAAVSPFSKLSASRLAAFFHPGVHDEVNGIVDKVRGIIQHDLVCAEREAERMVGDSIYPCTDMSAISYRRGNVAVLRYRVGGDPLDNLSDDPYSGMDPFERTMNELADDEADDAADDAE